MLLYLTEKLQWCNRMSESSENPSYVGDKAINIDDVLSKLRARVEELETEQEAWEHDKATWHAGYDQQTKEIKQLITARDKLKDRLSDFVCNHDSLAAKCSQLERRNTDLVEALKGLFKVFVRCYRHAWDSELDCEYLNTLYEQAQALSSAPATEDSSVVHPAKDQWNDGVPNKVYGSEWFIALLDDGEKVVLRALPEEYSYDYRTSDHTYYKAFRIKKWMQFPDSDFISYNVKTPVRDEYSGVEVHNKIAEQTAKIHSAMTKMDESDSGTLENLKAQQKATNNKVEETLKFLSGED